jgi:hypothetical protein
MKCAEEGGCLNREWTRIHANSCSTPVWVRWELLFNPRGLRSRGTKQLIFPLFLILFAFIRVHSRFRTAFHVVDGPSCAQFDFIN